jgi:hypothetical protein
VGAIERASSRHTASSAIERRRDAVARHGPFVRECRAEYGEDLAVPMLRLPGSATVGSADATQATMLTCRLLGAEGASPIGVVKSSDVTV